MATLLSLLFKSPELFGMLIAIAAGAIILPPWSKIARYCGLTLLIGLICIVFWVEYVAESFAKWMRKPATWEEDLPDLFI